MILIEKAEVMGFDHAIRGMRNPMNSWDKSDSGICKGGDSGIGCANCVMNKYGNGCDHSYDHSFQIGKNDHELMMKLVKGGPVHAKFRRMISVYVDITAPLYWWKEFDTYKVGTVANSCSTMHKIQAKEFTLDDFSCEHIISDWVDNNVESFVSFGDVLNLEPKVGWSHGKEYNLNGGVLFSPKDILSLTIHSLNACRQAFLTTKDKKFWWQMIQLLPSSYNQKRTVMLNYEVLRNMYHNRKNHKLDEWHGLCDWIDDLPYSELITNKEKADDNEALSCFAEISKLIKNGSLIGPETIKRMEKADEEKMTAFISKVDDIVNNGSLVGPETNKRMEEAYKILIDGLGISDEKL